MTKIEQRGLRLEATALIGAGRKRHARAEERRAQAIAYAAALEILG